jgi:two-component system phosphate regulon sensor histidine kinase PhoR
MRSRLSFKFSSFFIAVGLAATAAILWRIETRIDADLRQRIEAEMTAQARIIAMMHQGEVSARATALAGHTGTRLTLIDATGRVLADSGPRTEELDNHLDRSEMQQARLKGIGTAVRYSRTLKMEMLYLALPMTEGNKITGYVRLARPVAQTAGTVDRLKRLLVKEILLILILSLLAALAFSLRAVAPLKKLSVFTDQIRRGAFSGMIRIGSHDEIGELAEHISGLVETLQEKIRVADEQRQKLESVFAGMAEGVLVLNAELRIETVNRSMETMIGRPARDVVGRTLLEAIRNVMLHDALEQFRATKEPVRQEIVLEAEPPAVLDVEISAVSEGTEGQGKTMLVFHDVTRQKRLERMRTDFVANVTHEIRTPLTSIIGFIETLQQGALDDRPQALAFLKTIHQNAQRLNRLVDDLLTLSAIELGETQLQMEKVDVGRAVEQAVAVMTPQASEKAIRIAKEIPAGLPIIRADRDRLMQILLNILDNAIKFTPEGGKIDISADPGEGGRLTVRIADNGVGIPRGEIPRLGERFYRADKMRSRELGGTGLGLSIVKHLLQAHGGSLSIDSAPGLGTTVSLAFPRFEETQ